MATSLLKTSELIFYDSFTRTEAGASGVVASDAQIGGLSAIPKADSYAASKAYVDSVAANVAPHEGADFLSMATGVDALFEGTKLFFSDGKAQSVEMDTDGASLKVVDEADGGLILDTLRPTLNGKAGWTSNPSSAGAFALSHADGHVLTITSSRHVGDAVALFDIKAYNDGLDASDPLAVRIAQDAEIGTAYAPLADRAVFTKNSFWTSDAEGYGTPDTTFEVTSAEQVTIGEQPLLKVVFALVDGGAIGAAVHAIDAAAAPTMRPIDYDSRSPNVFVGASDGLNYGTYECSALRSFTALRANNRYRLLLSNWGGDATNDITNPTTVGSSNALNGVWEVMVDGGKLQFRRPEDWGGADESTAAGAWSDAPTNPAGGLYFYQEATLALQWAPEGSAFTLTSAQGVATSTSFAGLAGEGSVLEIQHAGGTLDVTLASAAPAQWTISAQDNQKMQDAGLAEGAVTATLASWYMAEVDAAGAHRIEMDGRVETFSLTPTTKEALPADSVPVLGAYIGNGAYIAVCSGIGANLNRGRGTAWVMNHGGDNSARHVLASGADADEQRIFIFKAANTDFDTIDNATLTIDEAGKLQIAPAGITPNRLAPSFHSWLDSKIGAGGVVSGGGGGGGITSSASGRNRMEVADKAEYLLFDFEGDADRITEKTMAAIRANGDEVGVIVEEGELEEPNDPNKAPTAANQFDTTAGGSGIISGANGLEIREGRIGYSTPTLPGSTEIGWTALPAHEQLDFPAQNYFIPERTLTVAALSSSGELQLVNAAGGNHALNAAKTYRVRVRHAGVSIFADQQSGIVAALFGQDGKTYMRELVVHGDVKAEQLELTSDIRRKTNIEVQDGQDCLARLGQVDSLTYNLASRGEERRYRGVSAQAVQEVMPELVSEGANGELSVDYAGLSSALCGAVGTLNQRLEELEIKHALTV